MSLTRIRNSVQIVTWTVGALSMACLGASSGFKRIPLPAFSNNLPAAHAVQNQVRMNGSGVAAGDVDGDGRTDLFFTSCEGDNRLFKNHGNFNFEDFTAAAGLRFPKVHFTGTALADFDGDSDLDLIAGTIGAGLFLFENDGAGRFTDVSPASGLKSTSGNMTFAIADFDGDNRLDLYVTNYRTNTFRSSGLKLMNVNGRSMIMPEDRGSYEITPEGRILEYGEADQLFRNNGGNKFTEIPWSGGVFLNEKGETIPTGPRDWGLAAMARDLNGDGHPDLYVCNDFFTPDRIWLNDGKGHLRAAPPEFTRTSSAFSMGIDVADFNRDEHDDFFVVDMLSQNLQERLTQGTMMSASEIAANRRAIRSQENRNTFFASRGDGTFAEISQFAGLSASDWSWCPIAVDIDLDGYEDLLVTTGHMFNTQDLDAEADPKRDTSGLLKRPPLHTPNHAFRNLGNFRFEEYGPKWGFADAGVSHGMCLADFDNDGDLDVAVNNLNAPAALYRNQSDSPRVSVRLKGKSPNTRGIGARIILRGGAVPTQSQEMISGGRYLSSDDPIRVFASGATNNAMKLEVIWPGGKRSVIESVKANSHLQVDENGAQPFEAPAKTKPVPIFVDASQFIQHRHSEEDFDDFARQSTLPWKLSELGPGIAWADMNGDGHEDLLVGPARGGELEILFNRGDGQFSRFKSGPYLGRANDDFTTLLGFPAGPDRGILLAGQSSYESGQTNSISIYTMTKGVPTPAGHLALAGSAGPLALADIDADGDLDLFVGARVTPGKYPIPAVSRLYTKDKNEFSVVQEFSGLISGAAFSDLDADGFPELILACEWSPIRVFKRVAGSFQEQKLGLEKFPGWWNGVTTGDFDGDGRMDIVASNWGLNTKYESFNKKSLRIHYGDWSRRGVVETILSYWNEELGKEAPIRGLEVFRRMAPELAERYSTHATYAKASVSELLSGAEDRVLEATTLQSLVFLNRVDHFEAVELPADAQWAPCFGASVADVNGDGNEDIFLSQNFTSTDADTSRCVEGRGVLLQGTGNGTFKSIAATQSGIAIYGDARGSAFCDYDEDGRIDLAVGQNRGPTRLFRNATATPGIRVRLRGLGDNTTGVGAVVRVKRNGSWGPAREVKAGSGYWSQESCVLIVARGEEIQTLWPGGKTTRTGIPAGANELTINAAEQ